MSFKAPGELIGMAANGGVGRTKQSFAASCALTFLAGAYIAVGGFLAIRCSAMLPLTVWGGLAKFIFAAVFPIGLMLVIVCGADLFTGNCLTLAAARMKGDISYGGVLRSGVYSYVGNFIGSLFVAYFLATASGLIFDTVKLAGTASMPWASSAVGIANAKCRLDFMEAFWRGVGCNWLVCLAVYAAMAAEDIAGKVIALWFPIMTFVALGMEHCVANMFFVPLGIFVGECPRYLAVPGHLQLTATWGDFFLRNLLPVTLGNICGGVLLVAGLYTIIFGKKK